jgi:uncharacterized protein YrzB (UPF0473 family)
LTEREDLITLLDEDGKEHSFVVLDVLPVDMKEYAILVPLNDDKEDLEEDGEDDEEAVIFRIDEEAGEQMLVVVDDEEEWDKVAREWENRLQEYEEQGEIEE